MILRCSRLSFPGVIIALSVLIIGCRASIGARQVDHGFLVHRSLRWVIEGCLANFGEPDNATADCWAKRDVARKPCFYLVGLPGSGPWGRATLRFLLWDDGAVLFQSEAGGIGGLRRGCVPPGLVRVLMGHLVETGFLRLRSSIYAPPDGGYLEMGASWEANCVRIGWSGQSSAILYFSRSNDDAGKPIAMVFADVVGGVEVITRFALGTSEPIPPTSRTLRGCPIVPSELRGWTIRYCSSDP